MRVAPSVSIQRALFDRRKCKELLWKVVDEPAWRVRLAGKEKGVSCGDYMFFYKHPRETPCEQGQSYGTHRIGRGNQGLGLNHTQYYRMGSSTGYVGMINDRVIPFSE